MPKLTSEDVILERITDAKATKEIKDYMYTMRRFVAGDHESALYGRSTTLTQSDAGRIYKRILCGRIFGLVVTRRAYRIIR